MKIILAKLILFTLLCPLFGQAANQVSVSTAQMSPAVKMKKPAMLKPILWRFKTKGPVRSRPVIVGDTLYVGSDSSYLFAIEKTTRKIKWKFKADSAISSNPIVDKRWLFITSKKGTLYALERKTGKEIWFFTSPAKTVYPMGWDYFISSPVVAGRFVIFGSGDNMIYALRKRKGVVAWKFDTGHMVRSTPVIHNDNVICATMGGEIISLSLKRGVSNWKFKAEGNKYFPKGEFLFKPLVHNDVIYAGSRDASLYAVKAGDGSLLWKVTDKKGAWYTHVIAGGDYIYAASSDGYYIQCLEAASGKEKWKFSAEGLIFSAPLLHNGVIYFGSHDRCLYAIDARTGNGIRRIKTRFHVLGHPAVDKDIVYIGSDNGVLFAIKTVNAYDPKRKLFRAVYYAPKLDKLETYIASKVPTLLAGYFKYAGYQTLDDSKLNSFIRERVINKEESATVIILASYVYPLDFLEVNEKGESLLAQFLKGGGTLAFGGEMTQMTYVKKKDSDKLTYSAKEWLTALDIDQETKGKLFSYFYDSYFTLPTETGVKMGMPKWWTSGFGVDPKWVTTVLAMDEHGRAASWIKNYGGAEGTGIIRIWGSDVIPGNIRFFQFIAEQGLKALRL